MFETVVLNMLRKSTVRLLLVSASFCCAFLSLTFSLAFSASPSMEAVIAEGASLPNGFASLNHDSEKESLSDAFVYQGTSVSFKTRRGPQTPLASRMADPETPLYEIELRIFDERGVPFLIWDGGDEQLDADWETPGQVAGSPGVGQDTAAIINNWHAEKK